MIENVNLLTSQDSGVKGGSASPDVPLIGLGGILIGLGGIEQIGVSEGGRGDTPQTRGMTESGERGHRREAGMGEHSVVIGAYSS